MNNSIRGYKIIVKLNLFNYVFVLSRAKFAYNSAFKNPLFRCE